jgi:hypothetical protein
MLAVQGSSIEISLPDIVTNGSTRQIVRFL